MPSHTTRASLMSLCALLAACGETHGAATSAPATQRESAAPSHESAPHESAPHENAPAEPPRDPGAPPPGSSEDDPLFGLDDLEALEAAPADLPFQRIAAAPAPGTCAPASSPLPIWPGATLPSIAASENQLAIASFLEAARALVVVLVDPRDGTRQVAARVPLEADHIPYAPAGIAALEAGRFGVAYVEADGVSRFVLIEPRSATHRPIELHPASARRASPIVFAHAGRRWVALERQGETPSLDLISVEPNMEIAVRHHIAGPGGAASSPSFWEGQLYLADPRAALTGMFRTPVSDAAPQLEPLGAIANLAASTHVEIAPAGGAVGFAYAAIGNAATSAIGWVQPAGSAAPQAIVAGRGYGPLHFAAIPWQGGSVVLAEEPQATAPESPRRMVLRVIARDGTIGATTPLDETFHGAFAQLAGIGEELALALPSPQGPQLQLMRCNTDAAP